MIEATIRISCGEKPDVTSKFSKGSAIRFFDVPKGKIISIEGTDEAEKIDGITEITFTKTVGDVIGDINSSTDRVGFVIAQSDTAENAEKLCRQAIEKIKIGVIDEK